MRRVLSIAALGLALAAGSAFGNVGPPASDIAAVPALTGFSVDVAPVSGWSASATTPLFSIDAIAYAAAPPGELEVSSIPRDEVGMTAVIHGSYAICFAISDGGENASSTTGNALGGEQEVTRFGASIST